MSYDVYLCDPVTGKIIQFDFAHQMHGGTYQVGGSHEAHLNITWNYSSYFYQVFGEKGIRALYGQTGAESMPLLKHGIHDLRDDTHQDYWAATEGNAKQALCQLLALAQLRPDGIWDGD